MPDRPGGDYTVTITYVIDVGLAESPEDATGKAKEMLRARLQHPQVHTVEVVMTDLRAQRLNTAVEEAGG